MVTPYDCFRYVMWVGLGLFVIINAFLLVIWLADNLHDWIRTKRSYTQNLEYQIKQYQYKIEEKS